MKKIGLDSETFNEENISGGGAKVKSIVRLVIGMMAAGNFKDVTILHGCEACRFMGESYTVDTNSVVDFINIGACLDW